MVKIRLMTNRQGLDLAQIGREKGVPAEKVQDRRRDLARVLDAVRDGLPITIGTSLIPPPWCRIHTLRVRVRLDRPWQEAVDAAGPDTGADWDVRCVGDLYVSTGRGWVDEELVLLNYPAGDGGWEKAQAWAQSVALKRTDPWHVFAAGEDHPNFHREVGINPTYVVETTGCALVGRQACFVWWRDARRGADLRWVGLYGNANVWFAFRR